MLDVVTRVLDVVTRVTRVLDVVTRVTRVLDVITRVLDVITRVLDVITRGLWLHRPVVCGCTDPCGGCTDPCGGWDPVYAVYGCPCVPYVFYLSLASGTPRHSDAAHVVTEVRTTDIRG